MMFAIGIIVGLITGAAIAAFIVNVRTQDEVQGLKVVNRRLTSELNIAVANGPITCKGTTRGGRPCMVHFGLNDAGYCPSHAHQVERET